MKVLVIGSGGREHVLVDAIHRSKRVSKIYTAPGNGGISEIAECVPIKAYDIEKLKKFALEKSIDWTVVGPELPLTLGLVDEFEKVGLKTFGVNKEAAQLEGSKSFAKKLLMKYNIPTASYKLFDTNENAFMYIEQLYQTDNSKGSSVVIKADGLAAGKGVYICKSLKECRKALTEIFVDRKFGESGNQVVIEDFLEGSEISAFTFCDGETIIPLIYAQDYKKAYDGDLGPNTGGMGSYTPVSFMTKSLKETVFNTILKPTMLALKQEGVLYKGILYTGLMIRDGKPYVLEFNVRFGDPEVQVILPLLKTDIIDIFEAIELKRLNTLQLEWVDKSAVCVVLASEGYPASYETHFPIVGLDKAKNLEGITIFHAGTKIEKDKLLSSGGRVINIVAIKDTLKEAFNIAYHAAELIQFKNKTFRKDIALSELNNKEA